MFYDPYSNQILLSLNKKYLPVNLFFLLILLLFTLYFIYYFGKKYKYVNKKILLLTLFYHMTVACVHYYLTLHSIAVDARMFYTETFKYKTLLEAYGMSMKFVVFINYIFAKILYFNYFSAFMVFSLMGFWGLLFFYLTVAEKIQEHKSAKKVLHFFLFLPGLNYWTAFISKDAVIFLAINLVLFSLSNIKKRIVFFLVGLALIVHIRPYVFLIVAVCLAFSFMFLAEKIPLVYRLLGIIFTLLALIPGVGMFLEHARMETLDLESADHFLQARDQHWGGGSSVDISHYNIVFRLFSYLYRPLFIDVHSIFMLAASFENLILLAVSLAMLLPSFITFILKDKSLFTRFCAMYFVLGSTIMAAATPNLGTAVRHKNMVIPCLVALFVLYLAKRREQVKPVLAPAVSPLPKTCIRN